METATTAAQTAIETARAAGAAARARRAARNQKQFNADAVYVNALSELKMIIEGEYPSMAKFCEEAGISKFNISRCWPKPGAVKPEKEMSVGLYSRICLALGLMDDCDVSDEQLLLDSSLRDYLVVNNNGLVRSLVQLTNLA